MTTTACCGAPVVIAGEKEWHPLRVVRCSYTWKVENFSLCNKKIGEHFDSPVFCAESSPSVKWRLRLYPFGIDENSDDHISLFLGLEDCNCRSAHAKFSVSVFNSNHEDLSRHIGERTSYVHEYGLRPRLYWGNHKLLARTYVMNEENCSFPDDELIIVVMITAAHADQSYFDMPYRFSGTLIQLGHLTDVSLIVLRTSQSPAYEVRAHTVILAARSKIFTNMFLEFNAEEKNIVIAIEDFDIGTVVRLMTFMYTAKKPEFGNFDAKLLYAAADRFDVQRLKLFCQEYLSSSMTAAELLEFTRNFNAMSLLPNHSVRR